MNGYLTPLPLTKEKPHQGEAVLARQPAGVYPTCTNHGAMNRVTADKEWWRCLTCNIGVEWHNRDSGPSFTEWLLHEIALAMADAPSCEDHVPEHRWCLTKARWRHVIETRPDLMALL